MLALRPIHCPRPFQEVCPCCLAATFDIQGIREKAHSHGKGQHDDEIKQSQDHPGLKVTYNPGDPEPAFPDPSRESQRRSLQTIIDLRGQPAERQCCEIRQFLGDLT